MTEPTILFVKPGAISVEDKVILKGAGVIVVEIENPADAKFVRAHAELSGPDILSAACTVIKNSGAASVREAFGKAIASAVEQTLENSRTNTR